jgi:hypothetical protein
VRKQKRANSGAVRTWPVRSSRAQRLDESIELLHELGERLL